MDIQHVFASNVRKYRKAAHLSQEKLAELAGLHRTYIGGIEQRRVNVSLKNIGKIADALGVDPAVLFLEESRGAQSTKATIPAQSVASRTRKTHKALTSAAALETASMLDQPADYALCIWHDGKLTMRPIEVGYEDLTIQILCELILGGHRGDDLVARYQDVHFEIMSFLQKDG